MNHRKIKELPLLERPYERCLREGAECLTDAQLLSIIIRTGSREESALELATKILALNYPEEGILGLLHLSLPQLMSVKGIGQIKGIQLLCIGELSKRIWKRRTAQRSVCFSDPAQVAAYYQEDMRHKEQEEFHIMMLNTRNDLIRENMLTKGTVNASMAAPRELFVEALKYQAVGLILVHNHPSGSPEPSAEDISLTKRIAAAGNLIGIGLLDHVIIGDGIYVSMKERGLF